MAAARRGAQSEMESLQKELDEKTKEIEAKALADLRTKSLNPELVDLYARSKSLTLTNEAQMKDLWQKIAVHLGQVTTNDSNSPAVEHDRAGSGSVHNQGLLIRVGWLALPYPATALPRVTAWLAQKGCRDLKYDFDSVASLAPDDFE